MYVCIHVYAYICIPGPHSYIYCNSVKSLTSRKMYPAIEHGGCDFVNGRDENLSAKKHTMIA